ncbi:MAG: hypothetical protein MJ119_04915 [Lachnospiraceae bacterium]|nr:hypothetical protein [Lachnospiraceae bacterium]
MVNTYTYKCPNCGAAVEFDAESGLLFCAACGQFYPVDEFGGKEKAEEAESVEKAEKAESEEPESEELRNYSYMEMKIFLCSSCGAEIMTNDVEVAKFCSYCGQSTIMFDRVSKERKPDKIIPFSISKEEALRNAKERFARGKFLKTGIENVQVDSVYGIYMPYHSYDASETLIVDFPIRRGRSVEHITSEGYKEMVISLDASRRLSDYASAFLEPIPMDKSVPFDSAYLSGFFADRQDVSAREREEDVQRKLTEIIMYEAKMREDSNEAVYAEASQEYEALLARSGQAQSSILNADFHIKNTEYLFVPVYFITFFVEDTTINLLVNGATGKVVGSIPVDEEKVRKRQTRDMIIYAVIFGLVGAIAFFNFPIIWSALLLGIVTFFTGFAGVQEKKKYEALYDQMNTVSMFSISRNREKE